MKLISFALTTQQFRQRTKTETRRLGWRNLKAGEHLMAVEKCMGLKPGEHPVKLGELVVTAVRRERLNRITPEACIAEGFPELTPAQFVAMFCEHMRTHPRKKVTVIQFRYL